MGINGSGKSNFLRAFRLLDYGMLRQFKALLNEFGGPKNIIAKFSEENGFVITYDIEPDLTKVAKPQINQVFRLQIHFTMLGNNYSFYEKAERLEDGKPSEFIYEFSNGQGKISEKRRNELIVTNIKAPLPSGDLYLSVPNDEERFPQFSLLQEELSNINCYANFDTGYNSPIRRSLPPIGDSTLEENGENLVQVLNFLKINNRSAFQKTVESLKQINSNFEDVEFINFSNQLELHLLEKNLQSSIPPQLISDGTLRFLCLMTILYNPNRGSIVCIDEPELGLHPDMLHTLAEAIKHAAETSQVIISTHSPLLLDMFEVENVRVFEKDEKNATIVNQFKQEDFMGWYDKFLPGEMWRSGDFGGNRW